MLEANCSVVTTHMCLFGVSLERKKISQPDNAPTLGTEMAESVLMQHFERKTCVNDTLQRDYLQRGRGTESRYTQLQRSKRSGESREENAVPMVGDN